MSPTSRRAPAREPAKRGRPAKSASENGARAPLDGRRSRDKEVLETAVRLFSEKGYASTSVQDVADALGMLKGSLYYYIDTKETLLRKIFETSHAEVQEIAERHRKEEGPHVERLAAFLKEYALWYLTNLQRASLFAREWRHASADLRAVMSEQRSYYDDVLREFIAQLKEQDQVNPGLDPTLATYFVMSAVSSLPDWFSPRGKQSGAEVAEQYSRMALTVLVKPDALNF